MATKTYTVKKGDTLSKIAKETGMTVLMIKTLNKMYSDKLFVGQVLKLAGVTSDETKKSSKNVKSTVRPTIMEWGLQSDTDNTIFATWDWDRDHVDHYECQWYYDTGDDVWFKGNFSDETIKQSLYNIPSNAKKVRFRVKPISKTYEKKSTTYVKNNKGKKTKKTTTKTVNYWTGEWSNYKYYYIKEDPPEKPATPSVEVENYKLTFRLDNIADGVEQIQFQVVKDDESTFSTWRVTVKKNSASHSISISPGHKYKVKARAYKDGFKSEWSDYSSAVYTKPDNVESILSIKATSSTSVLLVWTTERTSDSYDIRYATKKEYLQYIESSEIKTITGINKVQYEITGLESGKEYFFQVRATNDKGSSEWTRISSIVIGKAPSAPSTWSSTSVAVVGEVLVLHWVHNTQDNSDLKKSMLEITYNESTTSKEIIHTPQTTDGEADLEEQYSIDTSAYTAGVKISWRVKTAGITGEYGEWSAERSIDIYAKPTLALTLTNANGDVIDTVSGFPFYVKALAGPNTQTPLGYYVTVTSDYTYETIDPLGNFKMVGEDEEIFSKYYNTSDPLLVELSANNIDLEGDISYKVNVIVAMDSGLTGEASAQFDVVWDDSLVYPSAEIMVDDDALVAYIRPYCEVKTVEYYEVMRGNNFIFTKTNNRIDPVYGVSVDDVLTDTGDIVYKTDDNQFFAISISDIGELMQGVTLSVYRRDYDGRYTLIAEDIDNTKGIYVIDPHPALDVARYRIIAKLTSNGSIGFADQEEIVGESSIVLQWGEKWTSLRADVDEDINIPWSGNFLKLPYNVDTSEETSIDVSLVEYIGRQEPVSYYGTQLGIGGTWNTDIPKDDTDTLDLLRKLAIYTGDVYVREPSGVGYWANINVSFSRKHKEMIIPVTLTLKRVNGGV